MKLLNSLPITPKTESYSTYPFCFTFLRMNMLTLSTFCSASSNALTLTPAYLIPPRRLEFFPSRAQRPLMSDSIFGTGVSSFYTVFSFRK